MGRRAVVLLSLAAVAGLGASCKDATYVEVVVTTDVKCDDLRGVTVAVANATDDLDAQIAQTSSTFCDPSGRVGAVTVAPASEKDAEIGLRVVAGFGKPVDQCPPFDKGCIVARRVVRYSPHEALSIGVKLYADCAGIPCGARSTCVKGRGCVDAEIKDTSTCSGAGCGDEVLAVAGPSPGATGAQYIDFYADPGSTVCGTFTPTPPTFDFNGHTYRTIGLEPWDDAKGYGWFGDAIGNPARALAGFDDSNGANILQKSYVYDDYGSLLKFELAVANGSYDVTVGLGRPCKEYNSDPMNLWLEGKKVIDNELPNKVTERSYVVDVADGRLTLEMGNDNPSQAGKYTFLAYLHVVPR